MRPGERYTACYQAFLSTHTHFERLRAGTHLRPSLSLHRLREPFFELLGALKPAAEAVCAFVSGVPRRTERNLAQGLDELETEATRDAMERIIWAERLSSAVVEAVEYPVRIVIHRDETGHPGRG